MGQQRLIDICNSSSFGENDFVYLADIDPSIVQSPRYASCENFIGEKVDGYLEADIILKKETAMALKEVQRFLRGFGYSIVVYDGYRPQKAVDCFSRWALCGDDRKKQYYYPGIRKEDLFKLEYISLVSDHCKGYAVDISIMLLEKELHQVIPEERTLKNGEKIIFLDDGTLDMGTSFDLFHDASGIESILVGEDVAARRSSLKKTMEIFNFKGFHKEWWHYTYEK